MVDLRLNIIIGASSAAVRPVISSLMSSLGPVGTVAVGVGAAIIGIGAASYKAAADFQQAMLANEAHAGLAKDQVNAVTQALLAMGPAVGQGPTQLAQAMYPILSGFSGISNQAAKTQISLQELKLAAESVAGSSTPVTTAALAMTQTFNALGLQTNNTALGIARMTQLSDVMNQTITEGNMKWQDYANVAGKLATAIKGTGVNWNEASAALATMTNEGFTAQRSQTYLANLFTQLDLKTDSMAKNATKLGVAFSETAFKAMPLAQQLQYLQQVTGGNQTEILKLLNNNATALKTYNALTSGIKDYKGTLTDLNNASKGKGATQNAFDIAKQGANFQGQQLGASFQTLGITLGTSLLPVVSNLMAKITPLILNFAAWIQKSGILNTIIKDTGNFLGLLGRGFDAVWPHIQTVIKAVTDFANTLWTGVKPIVENFISWLTSHWQDFAAVFQSIWDLITGIVKTAWDILTGIITIGLDVLNGNWSKAWTDIKNFVATIWSDIKNLFGDVGGFFKNIGQLIWDGITNVISGLVGWFHDHIIKPLEDLWNNFTGIFKGPGNVTTGNITTFSHAAIGKHASGGSNISPGWSWVGEQGPELMYVPGGSNIYSNSTSQRIGGGQTFNITVNAPSGNGPDIATTVRYAIADMMRSYTPLPNITSGGRL